MFFRNRSFNFSFHSVKYRCCIFFLFSKSNKYISGILVFAIFCTLGRFLEMVSLVAMTVLLVLSSQCIGVLKFKIEKNVYSRE